MSNRTMILKITTNGVCMNNKYIAEGTVAFQSLREHDVWQGQSTGKYTLTLGLPE